MVRSRWILAGVFAGCIASAASGQTPSPLTPGAQPTGCIPVGPAPSESLRPARPPPRPALPPCANEQTGRSTCRKVEADRYNSAIADYNAAVFAWNRQTSIYANALEDWQRSVTHYAQCEIDSLNAEAPR